MIAPATQMPQVAPLLRRTKIIFGLGDWGPTTTSTAFMFYYSFFLTDVARLSPAYAAPVLLAGGLWDAINDPWIGVLADRVRTRWGRRRPFFLFGALPFALSFMLLWWVPPWTAELSKALYYGVVYVLFDTAFTLIAVPFTALTPELTEDYDERTQLTGYRMAVSMGGGVIAAVAVPLFAGLFPEPKTGYLLMAVVFGILAAVPCLLLFFGIRERFVPSPADASSSSSHGAGAQLAVIVSIFRNRPFRYAAGIYMTAWVTISLVAALFQYYLTYWLGMADQVELVIGLVQISALIFLPLIVWLSGRWGKQEAYLLGAGWWLIIMLAIALLPAGARTGAYALAALAGFGVAAAHVVPWSIVPDVLEVDELATGQRREGAYYGFLVFLQKGGSALALALVQWVLHLTGYEAGAVQSPTTLSALRWLMGPLPAVLLAGSMLLAWRYPLTRARHAALRAELAGQRNRQNA